MSLLKRFGFLLLAGIIWLGGIEFRDWLSSPDEQNLVSISEAIVGRPLTPVSVAGVARRTARRY